MGIFRIIRLTAGVGLVLLSLSGAFSFERWQDALLQYSPDGNVAPLTWMTLRLSLIPLFAPGLLLIFWEYIGAPVYRLQQLLDRLSTRTLLWGALLGAGVLRILVVLFIPIRIYIDWQTYHDLALEWATTGSYAVGGIPTGYFPPGWPFFLSRIYLIFGADPLAGIIANLVMSLGIIWTGYRIVRKIWGVTPARWTAVLLAFLPSQVLYVNLLCSEILFTLLFLISIDLALGRHLNKARTTLRSFLSGISMGLATLVRSITLTFPVVMIPYFFARPARKSAAALYWSALAAGLLLITVPWILRNQQAIGRATISANGGVDFYIGNNPNSGVGYNDPDTNILKLDIVPQEATWDRLGYKFGLEHIWQHPVAFLIRGVLKVSFMMSNDIEPLIYEVTREANERRFGFYCWFAVFIQASYLVFLILGIKGMLTFLKSPDLRNRGGYLLGLTILYWLAVHFVFFGAGRFHFPIMMHLSAFTAVAIIDFARRRERLDFNQSA